MSSEEPTQVMDLDDEILTLSDHEEDSSKDVALAGQQQGIKEEALSLSPPRPRPPPTSSSSSTTLTIEVEGVDGCGGGGNADSTTTEEAETPAPAANAADPQQPGLNHKWRYDYNSTLGRLGFALENPKIFHDVKFLLGKDAGATKAGFDDEFVHVSAHKTILAICSTVFEEMFFGEEIKTEYKLLDQDPDAFKIMLKFLYTETLDGLDGLNAIGVLRTAKRFDLPELADKTGHYLRLNLSVSNVVSLTQAAQELEVEGLEKAGWEFMLNYFGAVANGADFLNLKYANLCKLLDEDRINISELDFFNALLKWAGVECERQDLKASNENMRLVLADALALIRFPLMSPKEFALQVVPKYILSPTEVITIFQHLSVGAEDRALLPSVFCKSESRTRLKSSAQVTQDLIAKAKGSKLRVRVRLYDGSIKREIEETGDEPEHDDYYPVAKRQQSPASGRSGGSSTGGGGTGGGSRSSSRVSSSSGGRRTSQ